MLPMGLNVYDILKYEYLVLLSPALDAIEARLAK
jgi:ribosomal protein L4